MKNIQISNGKMFLINMSISKIYISISIGQNFTVKDEKNMLVSVLFFGLKLQIHYKHCLSDVIDLLGGGRNSFVSNENYFICSDQVSSGTGAILKHGAGKH